MAYVSISRAKHFRQLYVLHAHMRAKAFTGIPPEIAREYGRLRALVARVAPSTALPAVPTAAMTVHPRTMPAGNVAGTAAAAGMPPPPPRIRSAAADRLQTAIVVPVAVRSPAREVPSVTRQLPEAVVGTLALRVTSAGTCTFACRLSRLGDRDKLRGVRGVRVEDGCRLFVCPHGGIH